MAIFFPYESNNVGSKGDTSHAVLSKMNTKETFG
jgi:hypothetical protein